MVQEEELIIEPAFFAALRQHFPPIVTPVENEQLVDEFNADLEVC